MAEIQCLVFLLYVTFPAIPMHSEHRHTLPKHISVIRIDRSQCLHAEHWQRIHLIVPKTETCAKSVFGGVSASTRTVNPTFAPQSIWDGCLTEPDTQVGGKKHSAAGVETDPQSGQSAPER